MKQFIMKNIVLAVILVLTFVGSIFLAFSIWQKIRTISESMDAIKADRDTVKDINGKSDPNFVKESEILIKADTDTLTKKKTQVYRHFGKPYRPALLKFIKNIASPAELKADLPLDPTLVAQPKPKLETEDDDDADTDEDAEEVAEAPAEPSAPTDEEKAVFNPDTKLVVLSFDETALRKMLAELYSEIHQDASDDESDSFVIPDSINDERAKLFMKLFDQIIEAPEAVDPARAEAFRTAAAEKFAHAFAIFREDVQTFTLEDVTDNVAHALFLDALGLPRLMRQRDCRSFIDSFYEKYLASDIIPGIAEADSYDRERLVQDFIYGKNANRQAAPVADRVIPIIRNFQIKEDLFRRMKDSGIAKLLAMNLGSPYGSPVDVESDDVDIIAFDYTLEMVASVDAIDAFINSLQDAYKTDRVYVVKNVTMTSPYEELVLANSIVADHMEEKDKASSSRTVAAANTNIPPDAPQPTAANANDPAAQQQAVAYIRPEYELTDPHHPDYGQTLFEDIQNEVKCTIKVDCLYYRSDNITPQ